MKLGFNLVSKQHKEGMLIGYAFGIVYSFGVMAALDRKRIRIFRRTETFNKRLIEEVWVYLPADVKDKIKDETQFYNIAIIEDI